MSSAYFHLLTKHEYNMTRCQDGIILLFPIEGQLKVKHFTKLITVENEIYIINNSDIFSIRENTKTRCYIYRAIGLENKGINSSTISIPRI